MREDDCSMYNTFTIKYLVEITQYIFTQHSHLLVKIK